MLQPKQPAQSRKELRFAMNLSLGTGVVMLVLKWGAFAVTGSSAILSDAAESVVHIIAVCFAAYSLRLTDKPADEDHPYGHAKISFFSAGFEGAMIVVAALYIIYTAVARWLGGLTLENLGWGTGLTALASAINGALGGYLLWLGRKRRSLILEANGKHVLTDVWTSLGVVLALVLTYFTGWLPWDPICAILLALNILWSGYGLMRQSLGGLMDTADPAVNKRLTALLREQTAKHGIEFHGLRHRNTGDRYWVEVHLLFPEACSLSEAHAIATEIEEVVGRGVEPGAHVTTHLEPADGHDEAHDDRRVETAR